MEKSSKTHQLCIHKENHKEIRTVEITRIRYKKYYTVLIVENEFCSNYKQTGTKSLKFHNTILSLPYSFLIQLVKNQGLKSPSFVSQVLLGLNT